MTINSALAALSAGLDRDEQLARAAAERAAEWRSDGKGVDGGPFTPSDPEWGMEESGTHTIVYDEGWPLASEARHIANFDPKRALRQVKEIRELAEHARWVIGHNDPDCSDAGRLATVVIESLASIYTEDTTETEKP